jgi:hypothetical protein
MKYNKYLLAAIVAFAPALHAANIGLNNVTFSGTDLAIYDNSGTPLTGGFIGVFDFSGGAPSDFASLLANGNNGLIAQTTLGPANNPTGGAISGALQNIPNGAGQLVGVNLFVVIGNGADVASSTNLGLINSGLAIGGPDVPLPQSLDINLGSSMTASVGVIGANRDIDWGLFTGGGAPGNPYNTPTFTLDAIPEPSSSLLAGLAGIALLIRRRR